MNASTGAGDLEAVRIAGTDGIKGRPGESQPARAAFGSASWLRCCKADTLQARGRLLLLLLSLSALLQRAERSVVPDDWEVGKMKHGAEVGLRAGVLASENRSHTHRQYHNKNECFRPNARVSGAGQQREGEARQARKRGNEGRQGARHRQLVVILLASFTRLAQCFRRSGGK